MRQTDPYELEKTRDTSMFPVPVEAFVLPDLPVPEDPTNLGIGWGGQYTTEATPAHLDYSLRVYEGHGKQWLLRLHQGHPPLLIPFPKVQVAYAKGDKIFRRTSRDEASLSCGVVTIPDFRSRNTSWADFHNERVRVWWDGEPQDRDVMGRDIQLDRGEPRCRLM